MHQERTALAALRELARHGGPDPRSRRALSLRDGLGATPSGPVLIQLLHRGAFAGSVSAMYALGVCYEFGIDTDHDAYRATCLYRAAARELKSLSREACVA